MKKVFITLMTLLVLQNCKNREDLNFGQENTGNEVFTMNSASAIEEEYDSFYGFVIKDSSQHSFYCVDKDMMTKYISNNQIDSATITRDILKSKWSSSINGTSYDYFVWLNFIESGSSTDSLEFEFCNLKQKSQVTPVYITQFNRRVNNVKSQIGPCNDFFPKEIYEQPSLNLVYIIPLNFDRANTYLKIRNTLEREKYQNFIQNIVH